MSFIKLCWEMITLVYCSKSLRGSHREGKNYRSARTILMTVGRLSWLFCAQSAVHLKVLSRLPLRVSLVLCVLSSSIVIHQIRNLTAFMKELNCGILLRWCSLYGNVVIWSKKGVNSLHFIIAKWFRLKSGCLRVTRVYIRGKHAFLRIFFQYNVFSFYTSIPVFTLSPPLFPPPHVHPLFIKGKASYGELMKSDTLIWGKTETRPPYLV